MGPVRVTTIRVVFVHFRNEDRGFARRSALLVCLCHPTSSPHHRRLPPISFSDRLVFSRRIPLSRTIYAWTPGHIRFDLARPSPFHRRSRPALAVQSRSRDPDLRPRSFGARLKETRAVL